MVYYYMKFVLKMDTKVQMLNKENYQACIMSWFDPLVCEPGAARNADEDKFKNTHFVLTDDEKKTLIAGYLEQDATTQIQEKCRIGVGY